MFELDRALFKVSHVQNYRFKHKPSDNRGTKSQMQLHIQRSAKLFKPTIQYIVFGMKSKTEKP